MLKSYTIILSLLLSFSLFAQKLEIIPFSSTYDRPVGVENAGDDRIFIVEQSGKIWICDSSGVKSSSPFLDLSNQIKLIGNEEGLLGMAFHPNFSSNGFFYLNYIDVEGNTSISQFKTKSATEADITSKKVLLTINQPNGNHNGGQIVFGPKGYLYIGMGDGGGSGDPQRNSQNPKKMLGKMLRIIVDTVGTYSIPDDNPFIDSTNYLPEIWATGLRNPWRFSFDKKTKDLWIADVGQNLWEEIDYQPHGSKGGENYGWNCKEASYDFQPSNCSTNTVFTDPVFEYQNTNLEGCSVTGGYVYRGVEHKSLYGKYIFTDFCSGNIWATTDSAGIFTTKLLGSFQSNSYTSFGTDAWGEIYLCDRKLGRILRVEADDCQPVSVFDHDINKTIWHLGDTLALVEGKNLTYSWKRSGKALSENQPFIILSDTGKYLAIVENLRGCKDSVEVYIKDLPISVDQPSLFQMDIYPNPTHSHLFVKSSSEHTSPLFYQLVSLDGKNWKNGIYKTSIDIRDLTTGFYLLKVWNNDGLWTEKILVERN